MESQTQAQSPAPSQTQIDNQALAAGPMTAASPDLTLVAKGESIVQDRVRKELEILKGNSVILAAVIGIFVATALTYMQKIPLTGDHKFWWASVIGFVVGAALGERVMLVAFGIVVGLKFGYLL